jgi:hypothetical protein
MSLGPNASPTNLAGLAIYLVVVAAVIAVVLVAFQAFGIVVPSFVITIGWILAAAFVVVAAIRFLTRM